MVHMSLSVVIDRRDRQLVTTGNFGADRSTPLLFFLISDLVHIQGGTTHAAAGTVNGSHPNARNAVLSAASASLLLSIRSSH